MKQNKILLVFLLTYQMCFSQDLISEGSNKWIFHTPDDGRTTMWVAPWTNNEWQWGLATQFLNNGNMLIDGNLGIGTPTHKLEVNGNINMAGRSGRRLFMGGAGGSTFGIANDSTYPNYGIFYTEGEPDYVSISLNGNTTAGVMNIFGNGNVAIGTTATTAKLEIFNTAQAGHLLLTANDNPNADATRIDIDFKVANQGHTVGRIASTYDNSANGGSGGLRFYTRNQGDLIENARINYLGNMGIATTTPGHKLDVIGTIRSREVKVDLLGADSVFEHDYQLMPLHELEKYIKDNKHLPEIALAKEMQENGVNLGDLNTQLLQKIEELTLYTI